MPNPASGVSEAVRLISTIAIPSISGLVGVIIGAFLASRQQQKQRKLQFIETQLRHFYSPLLGIRDEIRSLSKLRLRISSEANSAWQELCKKDSERRAGAESLLNQDVQNKFDEIIRYDNDKFRNDMLPEYRHMIEIFKENYFLAEETTRKHFQALIDFVDLWDRWLTKALPSPVLERLGHREDTLNPFYEELQNKLGELRKKLTSGKP
jgi:hypothetical protein